LVFPGDCSALGESESSSLPSVGTQKVAGSKVLMYVCPPACNAQETGSAEYKTKSPHLCHLAPRSFSSKSRETSSTSPGLSPICVQFLQPSRKLPSPGNLLPSSCGFWCGCLAGTSQLSQWPASIGLGLWKMQEARQVWPSLAGPHSIPSRWVR
jgi:hypothetical protein